MSINRYNLVQKRYLPGCHPNADEVLMKWPRTTQRNAGMSLLNGIIQMFSRIQPPCFFLEVSYKINSILGLGNLVRDE